MTPLVVRTAFASLSVIVAAAVPVVASVALELGANAVAFASFAIATTVAASRVTVVGSLLLITAVATATGSLFESTLLDISTDILQSLGGASFSLGNLQVDRHDLGKVLGLTHVREELSQQRLVNLFRLDLGVDWQE